MLQKYVHGSSSEQSMHDLHHHHASQKMALCERVLDSFLSETPETADFEGTFGKVQQLLCVAQLLNFVKCAFKINLFWSVPQKRVQNTLAKLNSWYVLI